MKKLILILIFFLPGFVTIACPVCDKQQPKILQGISHGTGPGNQWDYVIVWVAVVVVLATLFYSVKWLIRPGEKSPNHIKNLILYTEKNGR